MGAPLERDARLAVSANLPLTTHGSVRAGANCLPSATGFGPRAKRSLNARRPRRDSGWDGLPSRPTSSSWGRTDSAESSRHQLSATTLRYLHLPIARRAQHLRQPTTAAQRHNGCRPPSRSTLDPNHSEDSMHRRCQSLGIEGYWDDGAGVRPKDDHAGCLVPGDAFRLVPGDG